MILDFDWVDGTTDTVTFYNDGAGPDPYPSPWGVYPFNVTADVDHIYGDNGNFTVYVTITDDDGGSATVSQDIIVIRILIFLFTFALYIALNCVLNISFSSIQNRIARQPKKGFGSFKGK